MDQIAPRAWRMSSTKASHAFLLHTAEDDWVLVDTGYPLGARRLAAEIESRTNRLDGIVITHHDVDHVGNAAALEMRFGAPVYIHESDRPFFSGAAKKPASKSWIIRVAQPFMGTPRQLLPLGEMPFRDIEPFWTPGHTPGHTIFRFGDVILAGDLFSNKPGVGMKNLTRYHADCPAVGRALHELVQMGAESFHPAHGDPVCNTPANRQALLTLASELGA